ncbi:MAG: carboxypeptidase regulatory-like domain-containing protein, partial [Thermoplasmata archaeon]|nr:carboxypeptidase regulatory-like domain-containing protein [Thermoplasmata archaeon]
MNLGEEDFTPGTYITGTVQPAGLWTVQACSTDEVSVCDPPTAAINTSGRYGPCVAGLQGQYGYCPDDAYGCPSPSNHGGTTFCVPAPPGPDTLTVISADEGQNLTWAYVTPGGPFQTYLTLGGSTSTHVTTINLTSGAVTGSVRNALTGGTISSLEFPTVTLTAAGSGVGGGEGAVLNGNFTVPATPGWMQVTATATNFEPNHVWVYVNDTVEPTEVGTIDLTPVAWLQGQVVNSNGTPMSYATVSTCPLAEETGGGTGGCVNVLSGGITTSDGQYAAKLRAGASIQGMYQIVASAPGFVSNFTWVNITAPGAYYNASPIDLTSFLDAGPRAAASGAPTGGGSPAGVPANPEEYVIGYVVDNESNAGLPGAQIALDPVSGGSPVDLAGGLTEGGFFNYTVPTGQYWANFTETGYYPTTEFVNVSGLAPQLDLGVIRLVAFSGYVDGMISIAPWASLTLPASENGFGIGPGSVDVQICEIVDRSVCSTGSDSPTGYFNVSAPSGYHDTVSFLPTGTFAGGQGSAGGGFVNATGNVNVLNGTASPYLQASLAIFGGVSGLVLDRSTGNTTPVGSGSFSALSANNTTGPSFVTETIGGGGAFTAFLAPGWSLAGAASGTSYVVSNFTSPGGSPPISAGNVTTLPTFSLTHFGWITGQVTSPLFADGSPTHWVPDAAVATSAWFPNLGTTEGVSGTSDATGYFNVSAPPTQNVSLTINAPDYNSTVVPGIDVLSSTTTNVSAVEVGPGVIPWGWINGTAWDPTLGTVIPGAAVLAADPSGTTQGRSGITTAQDGSFLTDAPPFPIDQLRVKAPGYLTNVTDVPVEPGAFSTVARVNLTADGVVAGRVLGEPGNVTLGGATIAVCPSTTPQCTNYTTSANQMGEYWALAPPGVDQINVTFPGYAANTSFLARVASDSWQWVGTSELSEFATVTGTLLGIPAGLALPGANASFCSTYAAPGEAAGPCLETAQTNPLGGFELSIAAGSYIAVFNATGYAPTYLPISLAPGEQVSLGSVLLQSDGTITGTVLGADTLSPVAGTQVVACANWVGGSCTGTVTTNRSGGFTLPAVPGPYLVTADAPGYEDEFASVQVASGAQVTAGLIELIPIGSSGTFELSGTVTSTANDAPIANAAVSAGGTYSTSTGPTGTYTLSVPWGRYSVTVSGAGYSVGSRVVEVHQDVGGIDFGLNPSEFRLSGSVQDGLTGLAVSGISLENASGVVATTDADGVFSLLLANGSYTFTVEAPGDRSYAATTFSLDVNGGPLERNLELFPPKTTVDGLVVDSASGLPVANATFQIVGQTSSGVPWSSTFASTELGTVSIPLYQGTYTISATAIGYQTASRTVTPAGSSQEVVLSLKQVPSTVLPAATSGSSMGDWLAYAAVAGAAALLLGGVFVYTARKRPKTWKVRPMPAHLSGPNRPPSFR